MANVMKHEKRKLMLRLLCEGNSLRSTGRRGRGGLVVRRQEAGPPHDRRKGHQRHDRGCVPLEVPGPGNQADRHVCFLAGGPLIFCHVTMRPARAPPARRRQSLQGILGRAEELYEGRASGVIAEMVRGRYQG